MQKNTLPYLIAILLVSIFIFSACNKEERLFQYQVAPPPPPPPPPDTAISVTALLNGAEYQAIGRALPPTDSIFISFYEPEQKAFLEIKLHTDTPGSYIMGRSVSDYTAVFYKSPTDKMSRTGFTSRATDDAGGLVTITEIDPVSHRVKGTFELLLKSRTLPDTFTFTNGAFDILYNFCSLKMDDSLLSASRFEIFQPGYAGPEDIIPAVMIEFPDSLELRMELSNFESIGNGDYYGEDVKMSLTNKVTGEVLHYSDGTIQLIRYNHLEYIQFRFDKCVFKSESGDKVVTLIDGSAAIGSFK